MRQIKIFLGIVALLVTGVPEAVARAIPQGSGENVEAWRQAVEAGNENALRALYVGSSALQIQEAGGKPVGLEKELAFWMEWKAKGLAKVGVEIVQEEDPQPGLHAVIMRVTLGLEAAGGAGKSYVAMAQGWVQEGGAAKIAIEKRSAASGLPQPMVKRDLYPAGVDAREEIVEALKKAGTAHKRVLLVFGANWCYDCHVLEEAFQSAEIAPTLQKGFEVLHIDIGEMNKNLDIAKQYEVPLEKGVPAVAVLESDGKLLFSHKRGEFGATRSMATDDVLGFLKKWSPGSGAER
jgi:thioredoxin 1